MSDEFFPSLLKAVDSIIDAFVGSSQTSYVIEDVPFSHAPTGQNALHAQQESMRHAGIGAIRRADPDFNLAEFLVRVGQMFEAYHRAFDLGDLKPARRFIDEGVYAGLARAAAEAGRRPDAPRTMTVRVIRPATARHENDLDLVRVLITADVAGQRDVLCEYWELIRKHGARTKAGLDLVHCPNCGAPVDGDDPSRCAYCGQRLADPALDWVVRKIAVQ